MLEILRFNFNSQTNRQQLTSSSREELVLTTRPCGTTWPVGSALMALGAAALVFLPAQWSKAADLPVKAVPPAIYNWSGCYVGANAGRLNKQAQRHVDAQASRPAATVAGRAAATKDPNRMSTDEWMRHRNAQLRRQR